MYYVFFYYLKKITLLTGVKSGSDYSIGIVAPKKPKTGLA